jgi:hypothetical protein
MSHEAGEIISQLRACRADYRKHLWVAESIV